MQYFHRLAGPILYKRVITDRHTDLLRDLDSAKARDDIEGKAALLKRITHLGIEYPDILHHEDEWQYYSFCESYTDFFQNFTGGNPCATKPRYPPKVNLRSLSLCAIRGIDRPETCGGTPFREIGRAHPGRTIIFKRRCELSMAAYRAQKHIKHAVALLNLEHFCHRPTLLKPFGLTGPLSITFLDDHTYLCRDTSIPTDIRMPRIIAHTHEILCGSSPNVVVEWRYAPRANVDQAIHGQGVAVGDLQISFRIFFRTLAGQPGGHKKVRKAFQAGPARHVLYASLDDRRQAGDIGGVVGVAEQVKRIEKQEDKIKAMLRRYFPNGDIDFVWKNPSQAPPCSACGQA